MKKKHITTSTIVMLLVIYTIIAFVFGDGYSVKLGNGYFYRDAGIKMKDILCEKPNGGEIPATIISFNHDKNFIIAKQKPLIPQEPLYKKEYVYSKGDTKFYYWIIIKKNNLVIGPMDSVEYENIKIKYKVSSNLILKH